MRGSLCEAASDERIIPSTISVCTAGAADSSRQVFLQPILKTASFTATGEHRGVITVTGYEKNGKLFLCVDDNGLGVTEARLCDVVNGTMPPSPHSHGIGVSNVFKRLRLRRAEADGCSIQSRAGGGVRVILDLGYFRP